jgi:signal transduction histidine kinase
VFKGLRLRMTFLYLLVAAGFTGLMIAGTHQMVARYFQETTDLALRYRMAQEFQQLGLSPPSELAAAAESWSEQRGSAAQPTAIQPTLTGRIEHDQEEEADEGSAIKPNAGHESGEEAYDGDLAAIYTLSLDRAGNPQASSMTSASNLTADTSAVASALVNGHDLRTIQLEGGTQVRLLTYSVDDGGNRPALLQLGRPLSDQQRVLNQLTLAMGILGVGILLVMSAGGWWLAGRSIAPTEEAWARQQTFIANAGHELRTPLTLLRANAEVALRQTPPGDPRQAKLEDVLAETDHMAKLVDDLLLLSRLDSGAVALEFSKVDARKMLEDLRRQTDALAAQHGVSFTIEGCPHVNLKADSVRLRQVLLILIDNALAHTPAGGEIRISCVVEMGKVRLRMSDTGIGISERDLAHVFERFYQVDHSGRSGSGLGLSIAKALVSAMGGDLTLTSARGEGTTAELTLPDGETEASD